VGANAGRTALLHLDLCCCVAFAGVVPDQGRVRTSNVIWSLMSLLWLCFFCAVLYEADLYVHEIGHLLAAIMLRLPVRSIRVHDRQWIVRRRRGSRWWRRITFHELTRRKIGSGDVELARQKKCGRVSDFIFSASGYLAEWIAIGIGWQQTHWVLAEAKSAWHAALLLSFLYSFCMAFADDSRGSDLYFVLRSLKRTR
jgi:hypothetical protein